MKTIAPTLLLLTLSASITTAETPTTNPPATQLQIRAADTRAAPQKTHTLCRRHRHLRASKNAGERD